MLHGYRFAIFFLVACIFHDVYYEVVTGFTFGYVAALFYYVMRYSELMHFYKENNQGEKNDKK